MLIILFIHNLTYKHTYIIGQIETERKDIFSKLYIHMMCILLELRHTNLCKYLNLPYFENFYTIYVFVYMNRSIHREAHVKYIYQNYMKISKNSID